MFYEKQCATSFFKLSFHRGHDLENDAVFLVFQGLNNSRTLPTENIQLLLDNLAIYMNSISLESSATMWTNILNQFDTFFRRLTEILPVPCDVTSVLKIITCLLKVNGINNAKVTVQF